MLCLVILLVLKLRTHAAVFSSCILLSIAIAKINILNQSVNTTWWQRCTMAEIRLQPPEPFNFRNPDDWPRWKRRFQQFREASGLDESSETKQVSTFLYCLGEESEAVLTSTNATSEERKEYKKVVEKFDSYFQVRKNVIFERARFNKRKLQRSTSWSSTISRSAATTKT